MPLLPPLRAGRKAQNEPNAVPSPRIVRPELERRGPIRNPSPAKGEGRSSDSEDERRPEQVEGVEQSDGELTMGEAEGAERPVNPAPPLEDLSEVSANAIRGLLETAYQVFDDYLDEGKRFAAGRSAWNPGGSSTSVTPPGLPGGGDGSIADLAKLNPDLAAGFSWFANELARALAEGNPPAAEPNSRPPRAKPEVGTALDDADDDLDPGYVFKPGSIPDIIETQDPADVPPAPADVPPASAAGDLVRSSTSQNPSS